MKIGGDQQMKHFVEDKAYNGYMKSFKIDGDEDEKDVDMTFDINKAEKGKILGKELKAHKGLKVKIGANVSYSKAQKS